MQNTELSLNAGKRLWKTECNWIRELVISLRTPRITILRDIPKLSRTIIFYSLFFLLWTITGEIEIIERDAIFASLLGH